MDFKEDLDFHDDSGRVTDKAKESILLMKKKMFRSHDLILQYNNIMKECDRLKGDLCITQEKVLKFQKETSANNSKILKLESQISSQKKSREELERKIAEQEIKIASDKCHTEQLICKLKEFDNKHSGSLIEAAMTKSSLEEKIKELEHELKKLKKSQPVDSEGSLKPQRGRKSLAKNQAIEKETAAVGVDRMEEKVPGIPPVKATTAEKSIMTDEFYHIEDNPYPIFCENCQTLTKPNIDEFCKMMTHHPPLLTEISSPPPQLTHTQELMNFNDSFEPGGKITTHELVAKSLSIVSPEIETLKQKLATLERKVKRRNKLICRETQQPSKSCCGHSHKANCCSIRSSSHGVVIPPIHPDVQSELLAEFWNRVMHSANEMSPGTNNTRTREQVSHRKSFNFNKRKMRVSMKKKTKKCVSSSNWVVESDDCENEIKSGTEVGKLLRLKTSDDFIEALPVADESNKKAKSVSKSVETSRSRYKNRRSKVKDLFNNEEEEEEEEEDDDDHDDGGGVDEPVEEKIDTETIHSKNSPRRSSSRIREKNLRTPEIEQNTTSTTTTSSVSIDRSPATADDSLCDTKTRKPAYSSESSKCQPDSVSRIQRSISCSPGYTLRKENSEILKNPNHLELNDDVDFHQSDSELNVSINSLGEKKLKSRSKLFDVDMSDHGESPSPILQENTRKRKRSNSPMRSKRSVKSKLLCKLRALKKNTTSLVTKRPVNTDDRSTATGLSQVETVCNDSENDRSHDISINGSTIEIASKKQRIAHVPKRSLSKERDGTQETRVVLEKLQLLPSDTRVVEKDRISGEKSIINLPNQEARGIHRSLPNQKGISRTMLRTKDALTKIKSPTPNNMSQLEKSDKKTKNNCSISEIGESENPTDKTIDAAPILKTASKSYNNILENSDLCENKENPETCETDEEVVSKNHSIEMTGNEEMKIERATKKVVGPEPSADELKNSVVSDSAMEICSEFIDESPASPDASQKSYSPDVLSDLTTLPTNFEHASIYENAKLLPDAISRDDMPIVAARNVIKYNTDLFGNSDLNVEEIDFQKSPDSQLLLDRSGITSEEKNLLSNDLKKTPAIVKDLRTRKVLCSPVRSLVVGPQNLWKTTNPTIQNNNSSDKTSVVSNHRAIRNLETLLTRHLGSMKKNSRTKSKILRKNAAIELQTDAEKSAKNELYNLVESEEWSSSIYASVVTKLCQVPSQRTVAKCIVDVLVERANLDETLDRTYTPPAPVMTRTQQRIAALINGLERDSSMSGVFELVRAGIDFNLFRLGHSIQAPVVEYLARMLTVMARLKKDRESVRIMCFDALYFLGRLAPNVIYIALSIWPEVLPMHNTRPDIMTNCLIHLVRQEQGSKTTSIKRLLRDYYKFPEDNQQSTQLMELLINQLDKQYTREVAVTILVIAKREGTEWAYKHIVHGGLMKIIQDDNCPWIANILTLLGFILRTFPTEDEDKKVAAMVEKLCNMLNSTQDSPDKEEGIVAALLSLARHSLYFKQIADTILKWKPTQNMRTGTIKQLESFFRMRSLEWWKKWKNNKSK